MNDIFFDRTIKEGGTAFPSTFKGSDSATYVQFTGMTLRDYFAAQALTGWISRYGPADLKEGACRCYQIADAMLEARGDG